MRLDPSAVLFDLDGTLLDTLADIAGSMNRALACFSHPVRPLAFYNTAVGDGMEMLARRCLPAGSETQLHELLEQFKADYRNSLIVDTKPYPGIPQLLDALSSRGMRLAVFSNKPDEMTRELVCRLLPDWTFEQVVGARTEVPRKPDPTGALAIARAMGCAPPDFLYLGDTDTDMKTAVAAGMVPVGVLWGFRSAGELRAHGAAHLITSPMELTQLI